MGIGAFKVAKNPAFKLIGVLKANFSHINGRFLAADASRAKAYDRFTLKF
jgi:hypothetical protein